MDHAIEYLEEYMSMDKDQFISEWRSGKYKSIKECPSYGEVKAYCDAINVLVKAHYKKEYIKHYSISPIEIIRTEEFLKK